MSDAIGRGDGPGRVPDGLLDWAERPGSSRLLREVRERLERGRLGARSRLGADLSDPERGDVGVLVGVPWQVSGRPVTASALRRCLTSHATTLEALLVATGGPIRDLRAERAAYDASQAADELAAREALRPALTRLVGDPSRAEILITLIMPVTRPSIGQGTRTERAEGLAVVCAHLPGDGRSVGLPVLAAQCFNDAHALDRSRPLGRASARLVAILAASRQDDGDRNPWVDPLTSADAWRGAWAAVGVVCDSLSTTVLVLNLPLVGDAPAASLTRSIQGEPIWLTARSLRGGVAPAPSVRTVFVCENPSVVEAAADRLGTASAPLVCTYGRPGTAALTLLAALADAGVTVRMRADDDVAGRQIIDTVHAVIPHATLWRMDEARGRYEEELIDELVGDLALGEAADP